MRRRFFLLLVNSLPGFLVMGRARATGGQSGGVDFRTLDALVDTIVPADEHPGALDIGIGEMMAKEVSADTPLGAALKDCVDGAQRLAEARHGTPFSGLDQADREELVLALLGVPPASIDNTRLPPPQLRAAASQVRDAVIRRYYADPEGQKSAGYAPPWPTGYRDDIDG